MTTPPIDLEAEKQEILRRYRGLLRAAKLSKSRADRRAIRKAFDISLEAHKDMRRKSGEPYLIHPIAVAGILANLRMDVDTIAVGLLHDTMEDCLTTHEELAAEFSDDVADMVDGVTKIGKQHTHNSPQQHRRHHPVTSPSPPLTMSRTVVYDYGTDRVYTGGWSVNDNTGTAHQRMVSAIESQGLGSGSYVGGSIKEDGHCEFRSESLNHPAAGRCGPVLFVHFTD